MSRTLPTELRKPIRFAHIVLRSNHFEQTVAWYETVLGARVVHKNPGLAFLSYDDEHHRLAIIDTPDAATPAPGGVGADHFAYTYASLGDLLGSYERLKAEGIVPFWTINHGPTTSMYYHDPDGMGVELQIDNFETAEELQAWMATEAFARNPLGVTFDPDKLVERYQGGDPIEELVQQGSAR